MNVAIDYRTGLIRTPIKRRRTGPARRGTFQDEAYKAFIRTLPCLVCDKYGARQMSATEAAHVGDRGYGQKCSDRETLPLCGEEHHRLGRESHHVLGRNFWSHHRLDRDALVAEHNAQYQFETGSVPLNRAPSEVPFASEAGLTRRRMLAEELYGGMGETC